MSDEELDKAIVRWLYGVEPHPDGQPATLAELIDTWRDRGGEAWAKKYHTDASFHAVVDAAVRYSEQAERERTELFAALAELWRIDRTMGPANPDWRPAMRTAMTAAWYALTRARRPSDPTLAD